MKVGLSCQRFTLVAGWGAGGKIQPQSSVAVWWSTESCTEDISLEIGVHASGSFLYPFEIGRRVRDVDSKPRKDDRDTI